MMFCFLLTYLLPKKYNSEGPHSTFAERFCQAGLFKSIAIIRKTSALLTHQIEFLTCLPSWLTDMTYSAVRDTLQCLDMTTSSFLITCNICAYCTNKDLRTTIKCTLLNLTWAKGFPGLKVITPCSLLFHLKAVLFGESCAALFPLPEKNIPLFLLLSFNLSWHGREKSGTNLPHKSAQHPLF